MSRGITLLIGDSRRYRESWQTSCIGTASYQHDGNTRLFTSSTAVPGRWRAGARHNANIAECALSTYYTLWYYFKNRCCK